MLFDFVLKLPAARFVNQEVAYYAGSYTRKYSCHRYVPVANGEGAQGESAGGLAVDGGTAKPMKAAR